jgi:hypothetical protein
VCRYVVVNLPEPQSRPSLIVWPPIATAEVARIKQPEEMLPADSTAEEVIHECADHQQSVAGWIALWHSSHTIAFLYQRWHGCCGGRGFRLRQLPQFV